MKFSFKEVSLGIIIALLLTIMRIASAQQQELEEAEIALEELEAKAAYVPTKTVSVEEQFWQDVEDNCPVPVTSETETFDFISLEDELQLYLYERCEFYGIDKFVALALMESESNFNTAAEGDNGNSIGLFQINKVWWDWMKETHGLNVFDSKDNIEAGLIIFNDLRAKYPDDIGAVIQCYKCGEYRGAELMQEGIRISACELVLNRAETFRQKKEAQE